MLMATHAERLEARQAKMRRLLAFLSSELWTTPKVAADLMHLSSRSALSQTLRAFQKAGLIVVDELDTPAGRRRIVGITHDGQALVAGLLGRPAETRAYERGRVGAATLEHRTALQQLRISAARAGWTGWTYPDRQPPAAKGRAGHRPDALVTTPVGERVALELERTLKTAKRYRAICGAHLDAFLPALI